MWFLDTKIKSSELFLDAVLGNLKHKIFPIIFGSGFWETWNIESSKSFLAVALGNLKDTIFRMFFGCWKFEKYNLRIIFRCGFGKLEKSSLANYFWLWLLEARRMKSCEFFLDAVLGDLKNTIFHFFVAVVYGNLEK